MTKTEHFQLNTWAPEDFVDLSQINENFSALDAALYTHRTDAAHTERQSRAARCNLANLLLLHAHGGADVSFAENVLLETFQNLSGVESYAQLLCAGGPRLAGEGKNVTLTQNYNDGGNSFPRKTIVAANGTTKIAALSADGWFTTQSLSVKYSAGGPSVTFAVYQGETLLGQSAATAFATKSDKTTVSIPLTATIDPNAPCELRAVSSGSGVGVYIWEMTLTASETVHTSGHFVTKPQSLSGTGARVYIRWSGSAPAVSFSLSGGAFSACSAVQTRAAKTHSGAACTLGIYEIDFGGEQTDAALRLKLALSGTGAQVHDICAAAL